MKRGIWSRVKEGGKSFAEKEGRRLISNQCGISFHFMDTLMMPG
jgi:hypothetical protein